MSAKQTSDYSRAALERLNAELTEIGLPSVDPQTFCALPFLHLSTATNGEIRLCCRSLPIANIREKSLAQVWESEFMHGVRRDLARGERRSECKSCWELEKLGMVSLRNGQNIQWADAASAHVKDWHQGRLPKPRFIELKLSNRCNLKCRMCSPISSTPWLREWPAVREYYEAGDRAAIDEAYDYQVSHQDQTLDFFSKNPSFLSDMQLLVPQLEEVEFAGGEPLIDPLHYAVLDLLLPHAERIALKYATNLSTLGTKKFDVLAYWSRFRRVSLTISIDGDRELNEYIRTGTVSQTFEANIERVRELANVELKSSVCVSAFNALYLDRTFAYLVDLKLPLYNNRVKSPHFLDARILPSDLRHEAARRLRAFRIDEAKNTAYSEVQRVRNQRTIDDCVAWLEDDRLVSAEQFATFLGFTRDLDVKRKSTYRGFEDWIPRVRYE